MLSGVGLVRNTVPKDPLSDAYATTAAATAFAAFVGLALRASNSLASGFVYFIHDLLLGVAPVKNVKTVKVMAGLGILNTLFFGGAFLTAQTSLETNGIFKDEVSALLFKILNFSTVSGCIIFNGAPMAILVCTRFLGWLRKRYELEVDSMRYIDELLRKVGSAKTLDDKFDIVMLLNTVISKDLAADVKGRSENSAELDCFLVQSKLVLRTRYAVQSACASNLAHLPQIQAKMKKFELPVDGLATVMSALYEGDKVGAANILRTSRNIGSPKKTREDLLIGYGMNAILPVLSIYLLVSHFGELDIFENETLNTLSGDALLYLSFTVSLLIQLMFNWCRSAASSPHSFCELSKAVTKTFAPTLFGVGAGYATKLIAGPALGGYGDVADDAGLGGGIIAAILTANSN